jgi:hypothetical protein
MQWIAIVGGLVLVGILYWWWTTYASPSDKSKTVIQGPNVSGKTELSSTLALSRSFNQPEGAVFTYTCWFTVNDFTVNYGVKRPLFVKGDCPGVYLDSTSNSLLIAIDTYGSTETILIPNIPAQKWVHLALTVNQYAVDISINGVPRQHHTLTQLPNQNDEMVVIGGNGSYGWDGTLSGLTYYNRALTSSDIDSLVAKVPPNPYPNPSGPTYFGIKWYTDGVSN